MSRCDKYFSDDEKMAEACRQGSRDAHLMSDQLQEYTTPREQVAYEKGKFTTFHDC